jgi:hypothetical protein
MDDYSYTQADFNAVDEEEKRRRRENPTLGDAVGGAFDKFKERFTDSQGDFSLGKAISSSLMSGGGQQSAQERDMMRMQGAVAPVAPPQMAPMGQTAPDQPIPMTQVVPVEPTMQAVQRMAQTMQPQQAPESMVPQPVAMQQAPQPMVPQPVAMQQAPQPMVPQPMAPRVAAVGSGMMGNEPGYGGAIDTPAEADEIAQPEQSQYRESPPLGAQNIIQTGAPKTQADVAGIVDVTTPAPLPMVDLLASAGYDERVMSVLSNPQATEDQLGQLRYDPTLSNDIKENIRERMEPILRAKLEIPRANAVIDSAPTDPKAARTVGKEAASDKPEGSWIKAILLARLGMTDLAQEEFIKLGLGDSSRTAIVDGQPVSIKLDGKGRVKSGSFVGVDATQGTKSGNLTGEQLTQAMIQVNDPRVKVGSTKYEAVVDGKRQFFKEIIAGSQTYWQNESTGALTKSPPQNLEVAFDKTIEKASIESATKAVEAMEKENAALRAKRLPARFSQQDIEQAFRSRQALISGARGSSGAQSGATGGTYRELVGGKEGGAASYDAIYGFGNPGGDSRIPAANGGKNLSQLTLGEALKIGDSRMSQNAGALGKYGFMPETLRRFMKETGLTENDMFSPENQDKLFGALSQSNAAELKRQGIEPTDRNLFVAHQTGAGGAAKLLDPKNANLNALDVLGLTSKAARDTNPQLNKPVSEYLATLGNFNNTSPSRQLASAVTSDANRPGITPVKPGADGVQLDMSRALPEFSTFNPGLQNIIKQIASGKESLASIPDEQIRNIVQQNALALNPNLSTLTYEGAKLKQQSDINAAAKRLETWEGPEPAGSTSPTTRSGFAQQSVKSEKAENASREMNRLIAEHPNIAGTGRTQDLIDFGIKVMTGAYESDEFARKKFTDSILGKIKDPRDRAAAEQYYAAAQKAANTISKEINPAGAFSDSDAVRAAKQTFGDLLDQGATSILNGTRDFATQSMKDKQLAEFVRRTPDIKNVDEANTKFKEFWKPFEAQINGVNEVRLNNINSDMAKKYGENWKETYKSYLDKGETAKVRGMFKQLTAYTADNERRYALPKMVDGVMIFNNKDQQFAAEYGRRKAGIQ